MLVQIISLNKPFVFERYSRKYSIYKKLYSVDLKGIEIRNLSEELAEELKNSFLSMNLMSYVQFNEKNNSTVLALGSISSFLEVFDNNNLNNDEIFRQINNKLSNYATNHYLSGEKEIFSPKIMGILNVTPDSFSDGGKFLDKNIAIEQALKMLKEGADVIDVGGESTRPGSRKVKLSEELKRIMPVIEGILREKKDAIISVDTYKSAVAREALEAGAKIVNDISGATFDLNMLEVISSFKAKIVLMHIKGTPRTMQKNPQYQDVTAEVFDFLNERIEIARKNGVNNIIIDPGIGFGKRILDNYELISRLEEFRAFGLPILIGLSRKSFLGKALNLDVDKREIPTIIAETVSVINGANWIRTHNVKNALFLKKLVNYFNNPVQLQYV